MIEYEEEGENEDEEGEAGCMEEACAWGGSIIGSLRGFRSMSEDEDTGDSNEKIEMIDYSGCRRTIVKPRALKGMNVKPDEDVGKNFRAANGAHNPNQGEDIISGNDAGGH